MSESKRGGAQLARAVEKAYQAGLDDYHLEPMVLVENGRPVGKISDGDSAVFCCRRGEREIELTELFTDPNFDRVERNLLKDLDFVIMTMYHDKFKDLPIAFAPSHVVKPLAQVLINLGVKRGMVVYGQDKLDEISLSAPTTICEMRDGWFKTEVITPEDFGFQRCTKEDLRGGTPSENAQITLNILKGAQGHKRNAVLLNAGAALYIGGKAETMKDGVALAAELIDSGKALHTLEQLIEVSNRPEAEV